MATKYLRKIILEELQKVLKEKVTYQELPKSFNLPPDLQITEDNIRQLVTLMHDYARDSEENKEFLTLLTQTDGGARALAKRVFKRENISKEESAVLQTVLVQGQPMLEKIYVDNRGYMSGSPDSESAAQNKQMPSTQGQSSASLQKEKEVEKFNISTEGKWGVKCKNAVDIQSNIREKVKSSTNISQEKMNILLKGGPSGKGRLGDGLMGSSTLSILNYILKNYNLGKGLTEFPLNRQGAAQACRDNNIIPLAIKKISLIPADVLANLIINPKKDIQTPTTQVASADTGSQISESKTLEKKILRELAKMLNK